MGVDLLTPDDHQQHDGPQGHGPQHDGPQHDGPPSDGQASAVNSATSLRSYQQQVDAWIKEVGVRYFSELTNLAQLIEEVGEMSRIISRRYGEQSFKPGEEQLDLGDEMADVLFVLICLANQTGVDLSAALEKNLLKKTARDHDRHRQNPKLKTEN